MTVHLADQLARCPARRAQLAGQKAAACNPKCRRSGRLHAHTLSVATTVPAFARLNQRRLDQCEMCREYHSAEFADCRGLCLSQSKRLSWKLARPANRRTKPTYPREF